MQDEQLLRYARHILLDDLGIEGQDRLLASRCWLLAQGVWARLFAYILLQLGLGTSVLLMQTRLI